MEAGTSGRPQDHQSHPLILGFHLFSLSVSLCVSVATCFAGVDCPASAQCHMIPLRTLGVSNQCQGKELDSPSAPERKRES
eukprot:2762164-Amphidinium_carterae.1